MHLNNTSLAWRYSLLGAAVFALAVIFLALRDYTPVSQRLKLTSAWQFDAERDQRNLGLDDNQCEVCVSRKKCWLHISFDHADQRYQAAFPGLFAELERARTWHETQGGIQYEDLKIWTENVDVVHAQTRVLLYNGLVGCSTSDP